jgi:hypothetical protein
VAGTGWKALYAMTDLVLLTFLSLRNVPDGGGMVYIMFKSYDDKKNVFILF